MKKPIMIAVNADEKLYLNGAVIKAIGKCRFEILNEATFLLHQHVMQPELATTPLRQLYFVIQTTLMDPSLVAMMRSVVLEQVALLQRTFENVAVLEALERVRDLVSRNRCFEALKVIRSVYAIELEILQPGSQAAGSGSARERVEVA